MSEFIKKYEWVGDVDSYKKPKEIFRIIRKIN